MPHLIFLVLREGYDTHPLSEPTQNMGAWWQAYQDASAVDKAIMIEAFGTQAGTPKRRRDRNAKKKIPRLVSLSSLKSCLCVVTMS